MTGSPAVSVVVPVHNGGSSLGRCLDALASSRHRDFETIVVDDESSDGSADVARRRNARVVQLASRRGPAAARNEGARRARCEILMFVDADVLVASDTLCRATRFLRENPDVAAVFGGYDDRPEAQNLVSQYKNLLHHFVHQHSRSQAMTFWAGCGAIRTAAFRRVGGFDEDRYPKPSIEDIDLGYRLREAGNRIWLDKQMQVTHLKRWSLGSLLRSDIFDRAIPWSRLVLEKGRLIDDLNLKVEQRVSAALVAASAGLLLLAPWSRLAIIGAVASAAAVLVINRRLIALFRRRRNAAFAARAGLMHLLYLGYSGAAFVACWGLQVTGLGRVALRWR